MIRVINANSVEKRARDIVAAAQMPLALAPRGSTHLWRRVGVPRRFNLSQKQR